MGWPRRLAKWLRASVSPLFVCLCERQPLSGWPARPSVCMCVSMSVQLAPPPLLCFRMDSPPIAACLRCVNRNRSLCSAFFRWPNKNLFIDSDTHCCCCGLDALLYITYLTKTGSFVSTNNHDEPAQANQVPN